MPRHAPTPEQCIDRALSREQLAARWGVSLRTIDERLKLGAIPHFRVGRAVRFSPVVIARIEAGEQGQKGRVA